MHGTSLFNAVLANIATLRGSISGVRSVIKTDGAHYATRPYRHSAVYLVYPILQKIQGQIDPRVLGRMRRRLGVCRTSLLDCVHYARVCVYHATPPPSDGSRPNCTAGRLISIFVLLSSTSQFSVQLSFTSAYVGCTRLLQLNSYWIDALTVTRFCNLWGIYQSRSPALVSRSTHFSSYCVFMFIAVCFSFIVCLFILLLFVLLKIYLI